MTTNDESEDSIKRRGDAVREPYDTVLEALYELVDQLKVRETQDIARVEEIFAKSGTAGAEDGHDEDIADKEKAETVITKQAQIEAVKRGTAAQMRMLSRTLSFVWIALMRAMRRTQGKGKVGDAVGGSRQIFTDARKRGRITSDVYIASALIEFHCYKDVAATKIFERGLKLFPEDDVFAMEYIKHLIAINDVTSMCNPFSARAY